MYKDFRYINAGTNEFYRYGRKAQERIASFLTPNENGFYSMPADGGKYYTIGTSTGKYGEFAKFGNVFLSVNTSGNVWAKVGTDKAETFVKMVERLLADMKATDDARVQKGETEMVEMKYFEAAVELMDDELREEIHSELAPCTDEEFLREYEKRHFEKYGEEFQI